MRFFFYGTLMAACGNPLADEIRARLFPLGPARATGRLFAIPTAYGWYPAFLQDAQGGGEVLGEVYEALPTFTHDDLAQLDAYEGDEYRREQIDIALPHGDGLAEAYVFRGALPSDAVAIAHGDFAAFVNDRGVKPYREPKAGD